MWYTVRISFFFNLWRSWCGNNKSPCALHCDRIWHRLSLWKEFETASIRADQSGTSKLQRDIRKGSLWETKMHAITLSVTLIHVPPLQYVVRFLTLAICFWICGCEIEFHYFYVTLVAKIHVYRLFHQVCFT